MYMALSQQVCFSIGRNEIKSWKSINNLAGEAIEDGSKKHGNRIVLFFQKLLQDKDKWLGMIFKWFFFLKNLFLIPC